MPARGTTRISKETKAKAVAMIETLGTIQRAAAANNVSRFVVGKAARDPEIAQMALLSRAELADETQTAAQRMIRAIAADAENAEVKHGSQYKAIIDAMLTLRGEPSMISATINVNIDADLRQIRETFPEMDETEARAMAEEIERETRRLLGA